MFILLLKLFQFRTIESFFSWFLWPLTYPHWFFFCFLSTVLHFGMTNHSMIHLVYSMPLYSLPSTGKSFQNCLLMNPFSLDIRHLLRFWMGFKMAIRPISQLAPSRNLSHVLTGRIWWVPGVKVWISVGPSYDCSPQEFLTFKLACTVPPAVPQDYHLNIPTSLRILIFCSPGKQISGAKSFWMWLFL